MKFNGHFLTPEEANRLLPRLRELFAEASDVKKKLDFATGDESIEIRNALHRIAAKINSTGVELKDLDLGLVDFPAMRFGEPVYLCWKVGESEVLFWHELTTGFNGRKQLKP